MKITFIIPCYNSEKVILKNYNKLNKFIIKNKIKAKIIYINDGSYDFTYNKLLKINKKNVFIVNNQKNLGKSQSIINCIKKIKTNYVILIDCDLPYFSYLKQVINNLKNNDLVLVNRKMKNSKNIELKQNIYQTIRNSISNYMGLYMEKKLNLKVNGDSQAGLKGFKNKSYIKKNKFISKFYFFDIELIKLYKINNARIKMIPVKYKISKSSSIKIFSFKNILYILEFLKVLKIYS
tara:strand:- start:533 stop:1240 length:708 start_codon:yes stop_codon:yes gene_type:complete